MNIWSGAGGLASALTNPTEFAKKKGKLKNSYPVRFDGAVYDDAERAYQKLKIGIDSEDDKLMARIISAKLQQHRRLYDEITQKGGETFLETCSHFTGAQTERFRSWEGVGTKSRFIRNLIAGYKQAYYEINVIREEGKTESVEAFHYLSAEKKEEVAEAYESVIVNGNQVAAAGPKKPILTPEQLEFYTQRVREIGYVFKTPPYQHQLKAFVDSCDAEEFAYFMEMGTGKTKVLIDVFCYLFNKGLINAVLVFGNKGSYRNWVTNEIPIHMPDYIERFVTYWDPGAKKDLLASYEKLYDREFQGLRIFVMNIEALSYKRSREVAMRFVRIFSCFVAIDESTTIKNQSAERTKAAVKLGEGADYRRIATGSPVTKSPMDLYSQCEFLSPTILGQSSYYSFRAAYADLEDAKMRQGKKLVTYKTVVGYKNLDRLNKVLGKFSYRVLKEDCLDLPPKVYETWDVELTDEQWTLYRQLVKKSIAELSDSATVSTPLVITKLLRLHQLVCGHLVDDDKNVHYIANNRITDLQAILDESGEKNLIWATYVKDIEAIRDALREGYDDASIATYYGATSNDARQDAVKRFQEGNLRFLVGNPRVGGYGITLTAAQTVVYYSNSYDLEIRLQSEDRPHRAGLDHSVTYIDMIARGTVDEKITTSLRDKRNLAAEILGDPMNFLNWLE